MAQEPTGPAEGEALRRRLLEHDEDDEGYARGDSHGPVVSDNPTASKNGAVVNEGEQMTVTTGRTVLYSLSESDAQQINRRRTTGSSIFERMKAEPKQWPEGAQAHIGNNASPGDVVPLVVVRVWPNEYGEGVPGVNGQAFLDGNDALWITSAKEGTEPGTWAWPPRV